MKNCWEQLGLQQTTDVAEIKKAYRALVKRYHPDTVHTPEKKRKFTVRCAQINDAYNQALKEAKDLGTKLSTESGLLTNDAVIARKQSKKFSYLSVLTHSLAAIFAFVFLIAISVGIYYAISGINSLSETNPIRVVVTIFLHLVVGTTIYGFVAAGIIDFLLMWLFPTTLLERIGLAKYENKIIWLFILSANIVIFFYADFLGKPSGFKNEQMSALYEFVLRTSAAVTIPIWLALDWLKDVIRYKRITKNMKDLIQTLEKVAT